MKLIPGKINIVFDGQFGSTGKGLISGKIAQDHRRQSSTAIKYFVTNAAPNAGHTVDFGDGPLITNHLPCGVLASGNRNAIIYLCAGSIINPLLLKAEIEKFGLNPENVVIHPHAAIIEKSDVDAEQKKSSSATKIASTQKGVGSALMRKIAREGNVAMNHKERLEAELGVKVRFIDFTKELKSDEYCLMEVPQGYSLGVNSGFYPYTTSREVSVSQALSDLQVPPQALGNVMMTARTFPIRVGNIVDEATGKELGNSGPWFADQRELGWDFFHDVVPEKTTVTGRIRRIATFSFDQYKLAARANCPSHVFLNFCNYLNSEDEFLGLISVLVKYAPPTHLGFGPRVQDIVAIESPGSVESSLKAFRSKFVSRAA